MKRRLFRKWALWLLPILAVRAFLPTGFMLSADAAGLHLAFCPTQSPALVQALAMQQPDAHPDHQFDHSEHHQVAASGHEAHEAGQLAALDPPCPYALAAVAIAADVARLAADLPHFVDDVVSFRASHWPADGPLRADRIRGPPSLS